MFDSLHQAGNATLGPGLWLVIWSLIKIVAVVAPLMGCVAYLTLWERKAIGWTQIRPGPNRVGPFGLLTPIADAVKLIFKEIIRPTAANKGLFFLGPIMTIMPALAAWAVIPFGPDVALANVNAGLLFLMAITSLEVYGVIIAGWASNSKYAFLGALRASAQMVSYEIAMGFALVVVLMVAGSMNMSEIVTSQGRGRSPTWAWASCLELAAAAADLRRLLHLRPGRDQPPPLRRGGGRVGDRRRPHDRVLGHVVRDVLPGRIREHDPGEHADRAAVPRRLAAAVRVPGVHPGLDLAGLKVFVVVTMFLWVRATFPRYRYDQIMRLGWKIFIPITLVWLVVVGLWIQSPFNIWK
jgi:NADH-quinone oxidoreductase subunit H